MGNGIKAKRQDIFTVVSDANQPAQARSLMLLHVGAWFWPILNFLRMSRADALVA